MPDDTLRKQRAALADFGLFAFRCGDLDALLTRAAELVSDALQVDLVKVLEHRPEQADFLLRAGVNWDPGVVGHVTFADHERSPAGYALLKKEPVVSRSVDRERRFDIPEVLAHHGVKSMVNVIIVGEEAPFGVLEVDARAERDFDNDDIAFLQNYANLLAAAIDRVRRHGDLERGAREQSLLARELGHRVSNILSLVQALASQTSVQDRLAEDYRDEFLGRLQALSKAESVIFEKQGETADLHRLTADILAPYSGDRPEAIRVSGPSSHLSPRKGRMFGLVLHELATNAAKYGALSVPEGQVRLDWEIEDDAGARLSVRWQEIDGPQVTPPVRRGFGSRLLKAVVSIEMDGDANLDYCPSGLVYKLSFPLA